MERLFKKLKHNNKMLSELDNEEEMVRTLPYYEIFDMAHERGRDIKIIADKKKEVLSERHTILENIQVKAEKEKAMTSILQRNLQLIYNQ